MTANTFRLTDTIRFGKICHTNHSGCRRKRVFRTAPGILISSIGQPEDLKTKIPNSGCACTLVCGYEDRHTRDETDGW